ncbi:hypothetical protein H4582DRAFT_2060553 [Lactarius indigo]|nr:hypothetical protein H4582DRAFT_2060553 [Lactarius indigo]
MTDEGWKTSRPMRFKTFLGPDLTGTAPDGASGPKAVKTRHASRPAKKERTSRCRQKGKLRVYTIEGRLLHFPLLFSADTMCRSTELPRLFEGSSRARGRVRQATRSYIEGRNGKNRDNRSKCRRESGRHGASRVYGVQRLSGSPGSEQNGKVDEMAGEGEGDTATLMKWREKRERTMKTRRGTKIRTHLPDEGPPDIDPYVCVLLRFRTYELGRL